MFFLFIRHFFFLNFASRASRQCQRADQMGAAGLARLKSVKIGICRFLPFSGVYKARKDSRVQLLTPDPKNRIQTILGAFTGLLSGCSQCRCRDKIKNMDFGASFGYGRRAVAETFIFLFSRLPLRVRDVVVI